jgi:hypothetical protein
VLLRCTTSIPTIVACGCYPLAPSKYVISNRNAAEGSLSDTRSPSGARAAVNVVLMASG